MIFSPFDRCMNDGRRQKVATSYFLQKGGVSKSFTVFKSDENIFRKVTKD